MSALPSRANCRGNKVVVSVCCTAYNHADFIKKALSGFLRQKTSFLVEILIFDDASTDGTSQIIKEFQKAFPEKIRHVMSKENIYKDQSALNGFHGYEPLMDNLFPLAEGKYIALCEGDDYWTDPNKLEKQFAFMEAHPEHVMCYHPCAMEREGRSRVPYGSREDFSREALIASPSGIATSTKFFRNIFLDKKVLEDATEFCGDYLLNSYLGQFGSCGFLPNVKHSVYSVHRGGVWSKKTRFAKGLSISCLKRKLYELYRERDNNKAAAIREAVLEPEEYIAVITTVYQRADGKSPYYLERALKSIFSQTHKKFKVFVIGDRYEDNSEFWKIVSKFPADQLSAVNLDYAEERSKYEDSPEKLWCSGGCTAASIGIDRAIDDGLVYMCLLDYDDYWRPNHLAEVNKAIIEKKADWVCTKSTVNSTKKVLPKIVASKSIFPFLPVPCGLIKSSVCYNIRRIPLRTRDVFEATGKAFPGDADLWGRTSEYIQEKGLKSFLINKETCVHDTEGYIRKGGKWVLPSARFGREVDVSVITCTGDRPVAFSLLKEWMERQTKFPRQWIVVDDGEVPLEDTEGFEYHRRKRTSKDTSHTLCQNLSLALSKVCCDKILIMEDDDWYAPGYIEYMAKLLDSCDLVGIGKLVFYFPSKGLYTEKSRVKQPALAQTGFRSNLIPIIQKICKRAPDEFELSEKGLVDVFLWSDPLNIKERSECAVLTQHLKIGSGRILPKGHVFPPPIPIRMRERAAAKRGACFEIKPIERIGNKQVVFPPGYLSVGMKGMPGRHGRTSHHFLTYPKYKEDVDWNLLRKILGRDADRYINLSQKLLD